MRRGGAELRAASFVFASSVEGRALRVAVDLLLIALLLAEIVLAIRLWRTGR
jgi:hypothetical protein